ncbi:hypothetical protein EZV62_013137 [Acer yangbiense]|uniref:DUF4218 domain-containing protein n=1 Tax=Acer yangbiense TaxID=1000413 RepID=A0A5C7HY51_9ROSI|nr:hypothetical protein EZV62_013137 [Acer yangbiense]
MKEHTIFGLKSHDSHILMQQLLPLAARRALPKNVVEALIELSNFFRQLCSKVNLTSDLENIQDRIGLTLCHLEKIFPMSFFDVMEHLPIHLAEEALIAGPVQFRWMYPIERYLSTLKRYVRNRAHPEASIAKGCLMEECTNFCSRYLNDVETKWNRPPRIDGRFNKRKGVRIHLDEITWVQAHRYVLVNSDVVTPFREKHLVTLQREMPRAAHHHIQKIHNDTFHTWFMDHVQTLRRTTNEIFPEEVINLANGPDQFARRFKRFDINGFRFRTKNNERSRVTQNSGVVLKADTMSYASARDRNPRAGNVTFHGVLMDVIEIRYTNDMKFVLFKCDWVNNQLGKKQDEFNLTMVNFNHLMYKDNHVGDEPFILAGQAEQVVYVQDPLEHDWFVVLKVTVRDLFDMYSRDSSYTLTTVPQVELYAQQQLEENVYLRDEDVGWVRQGVDGIIVDANCNDGDADMEDCD